MEVFPLGNSYFDLKDLLSKKHLYMGKCSLIK